jgi:hypothetical protein
MMTDALLNCHTYYKKTCYKPTTSVEKKEEASNLFVREGAKKKR